MFHDVRELKSQKTSAVKKKKKVWTFRKISDQLCSKLSNASCSAIDFTSRTPFELTCWHNFASQQSIIEAWHAFDIWDLSIYAIFSLEINWKKLSFWFVFEWQTVELIKLRLILRLKEIKKFRWHKSALSFVKLRVKIVGLLWIVFRDVLWRLTMSSQLNLSKDSESKFKKHFFWKKKTN